MRSPANTLVFQFLLAVALIAAIAFTARHDAQPRHPLSSPEQLLAAAATVQEATSTSVALPEQPEKKIIPEKVIPKIATIKATESTPSAPKTENQIKRITDPYLTAPLSSMAINQRARAAIVNILCTNSTGLLNPISGSGVMIDPRGVILTNAHVAQYVLLSQSPLADMQCYIRTGSPAAARWIPEVLYIPGVWVDEHASELTSSHVFGTGEHDYALLRVAASMNGAPLPAEFAYLPVDTREGIAFVDDPVLVASYPAEFLGGLAATNSLFSASSPTTVRKMLTFTTEMVDVISLGGVIEAQSGSSGGAVVNAWGYLVGLIATMGDGPTTDVRDLRAITLSYIDRDMKTQLGINLDAVLDADPAVRAADFAKRGAPQLVKKLLQTVGR